MDFDNPSHDSNLADNTATGSVQLVSDLRLRFLSDESWDNGLPLKIGVETTYSISVTSDEGAEHDICLLCSFRNRS